MVMVQNGTHQMWCRCGELGSHFSVVCFHNGWKIYISPTAFVTSAPVTQRFSWPNAMFCQIGMSIAHCC